MASLKSVFVRDYKRLSENDGLRFWRRSPATRKIKVYAFDFVGRSFFEARRDERIGSRSRGFLKSA